jgi:hypothetical protein
MGSCRCGRRRAATTCSSAPTRRPRRSDCGRRWCACCASSSGPGSLGPSSMCTNRRPLRGELFLCRVWGFVLCKLQKGICFHKFCFCLNFFVFGMNLKEIVVLLVFFFFFWLFIIILIMNIYVYMCAYVLEVCLIWLVAVVYDARSCCFFFRCCCLLGIFGFVFAMARCVCVCMQGVIKTNCDSLGVHSRQFCVKSTKQFQ